jgi:hypothetical protein
MSEYSYDDRPRRQRSTREREREREPQYVREETYIERGGRGGQSAAVRDLVYRPAREDSIEDIPRDFPPPGSEYRKTKYREEYEPRRTRSAHRDYDYEDYTRHDRGRRPRDDYDDYDDFSERHSERPKPQRRKSIVDNIKDFGESAGLGGIIGAVTGRDRSKSRHRRDRSYDSERYGAYDDRRSRRYSSGSRSPSRRGGNKSSEKWEQAAKAAIVAGAVEAFRSRKTPGPWTGEKGQRIATAALGAAGIDSLVDKNSNNHSKRHVAEAAIGGLLANRVANGPRSRSRGPNGSRSPSRSRSRSRARSIFGRSRSRGRARDSSSDRGGGDNTIAKVAGGGAVLAAGKALYDRVRSKSRARRERSRSSSADSYDPPSRNRNRGYDRGRSMDDPYSGGQEANQDRRLATATGAGAVAASSKGRRDRSSSSTSTTDMELKRKKLRGKELLTAGLATVATIHAAHGVYSSMEASENRRKLVAEGEMSPEEARKRKSKNMLQDAAAVGIAALGIKSAFSEWKEMNEQRHSVKELETRRRKRRKARERREKEARQNAYLGQSGMANAYAYPIAPNPYPTTYADANPYAAVPPPPIGAPPSARY